MTTSVSSVDFYTKINELKEQEDAKKAEELKKQQEEKARNDTIRQWTGIDNEATGMTYFGQCLASPITVSANATGGILSGLFSAIGGILKPIAGFLSAIFGSGQSQAQGSGQSQAQGNRQNAGNAGQTSGSDASTAETDNKNVPTKSGSTSGATSFGSLAKSSSAVKNAESGIVKDITNHATGLREKSINTNGAEHVDSQVRALVEEYNDSTNYVNSCQKEYDDAEKALSEFKNKNSNVQADEHAKIQEQINQHDVTIGKLTSQYSNVEKDIQGQQKLLESCGDDDTRKGSINSTISSLQAELGRLKEQIKTEENKKKEAETQLQQKTAGTDKNAQELAKLEAKVGATKERLTQAKTLQEENKKAAEAAAQKVSIDASDTDAVKAGMKRVEEDNKILDEAEANAVGGTKAEILSAISAEATEETAEPPAKAENSPTIKVSDDGTIENITLSDGTILNATKKDDGTYELKTNDGVTCGTYNPESNEINVTSQKKAEETKSQP